MTFPDHSPPTHRLTSDLNAVILHADEEAGGELGAAGAGVEEGWGGVREPALRHEIVCLEGRRGELRKEEGGKEERGTGGSERERGRREDFSIIH